MAGLGNGCPKGTMATWVGADEFGRLGAAWRMEVGLRLVWGVGTWTIGERAGRRGRGGGETRDVDALGVEGGGTLTALLFGVGDEALVRVVLGGGGEGTETPPGADWGGGTLIAIGAWSAEAGAVGAGAVVTGTVVTGAVPLLGERTVDAGRGRRFAAADDGGGSGEFGD